MQESASLAEKPDRGNAAMSSPVVHDHVRGPKNAIVRERSKSMMTRVVNLAWAICAALLCIVLCGCGDGGSCTVAPQPPMVSEAGEFQHILSYGQSLSLGARAVNRWPTDLTIPPEQDVGLMFASGVIPRGAMNALVPFADSTAPVDMSAWNIETPGVTPLYGALLELKGLPGARIGSAAGRGATSITGLSKGTAPYARLISQVAAGHALSVGHYSVPAIIWMQGESDAGNPNYAAQLQQLFTDLDADVRETAGQAQTVQFFICLTAVRDIALAQRQVAAAMPNVHIACETATLPKSDETHLSAQGSLEAGCALGAHMRSLIPANEWNP
jgi:Carbohydrate esterase, sialic acid-specific acetylesterase